MYNTVAIITYWRWPEIVYLNIILMNMILSTHKSRVHLLDNLIWMKISIEKFWWYESILSNTYGSWDFWYLIWFIFLTLFSIFDFNHVTYQKSHLHMYLKEFNNFYKNFFIGFFLQIKFANIRTPNLVA